MYCNNCGKEIDSGTICNECAAAQASSAASTEEKAPIATPVAMTACEPTSEPVVPTKPVSTLPEPENRMYGFSKALTSTILGVVGAVFAFISYFFALMSAEIIEAAPAAFLLTLLAIVPMIISIMLGIKSIKLFKERKATCVKPIATLILGIVGLSTAVYGLIFAGLSLFFLMIFLALLL